MKRYICIHYLAIMLLSTLVLLNFHLFARTTVDDAFITWRYGKNLIEAGIWGYNPTSFDLTQAYTNPIYAVLSIIPAWLRIDTVLFFKLVSCASLLLPVWLVCRPGMDKMRFALVYLLFLALPATMVHVFAGLETFTFVVLLAGLFIALLEARFWAVISLAATLLLVRPEAWVLVGLVPAYILVTPAFVSRFRQAFVAFVVLGGAFGIYALFHYLHFGYVLPNTFYIKAGVPFNLNVAAYFLAYLLPLAAIGFTPHRRLILVILGFYLPMIASYSSADLQMNYAARFAFHIWAPVFLLMGYIIAMPMTRLRVQVLACITIVCTLGLIIFYSSLSAAGNQLIANVYPRMLNAHAAIGKALARSHAAGETQSFALSDAGAGAFYSGIVAFDNTGLGSSLVAHQGVTPAVIDRYNPDVVILRADAQGVVLNSMNKRNLYSWAQAKKMTARCDVLLRPGYALRIFSIHAVAGIQEICKNSEKANSQDEAAFFYQSIKQPPWRYWHE